MIRIGEDAFSFRLAASAIGCRRRDRGCACRKSSWRDAPALIAKADR
jgi:hypothetical protein